MITVMLNQQPLKLENRLTLKTLLDQHGYFEDFLAVAINKKFIPRHQYLSTWLREGDFIEIVAPMSGG